MVWENAVATPITTIIPTLLLKPEYADLFEISVGSDRLVQLTRISHALDELLNRAPNRHAPYVGASAFATKAGIHASAVLTDPKTYEHVARKCWQCAPCLSVRSIWSL